jgi:hypothetical protein
MASAKSVFIDHMSVEGRKIIHASHIRKMIPILVS